MIGFTSGLLLVPFIITIVLYLLLRRYKYKTKTYDMIFIDIVFIAYCFVVIALVYFPLEIHQETATWQQVRFNLVPLLNPIKSIEVALRVGSSIVPDIAYLIGNLLLFVPLSLYLMIRFPDRPKRNILLIVSISLGAEFVQLILVLLTGNLNRIINIDDLIMNFSGALLAWILAKKILLNRREAVQ